MSNIHYRTQNDISFDYIVYRNGAPYCELEEYSDCRVTYDADSDTQFSFSGVFHQYSDSINWYADRLRVQITVNGVTEPLGEYCITTTTPSVTDGRRVIRLEGYSILYWLNQCKLVQTATYAQGTGYAAMVNTLLTAAGITNYTMDSTSATLATDREDWGIGDSYLDIINTLLDEITYNKLTVSLTGQLLAKAYTAPTLAGVTKTYSSGMRGLISADFSLSTDYYNKFNYFVVVCENPELSAPLRAVSENTDTSCPFSSTSLGRRVPMITRVDNTPSQTALQAYADRQNAESRQTNEEIVITTALIPHEANETLLVNLPDIAGVFRETYWTMELAYNGTMTHRAERVII